MSIIDQLFPVSYRMKVLFPIPHELVIINWLNLELDPGSEFVEDHVKKLHGFRNREVHDFIVGERERFGVEFVLNMYLTGSGPGAVV